MQETQAFGLVMQNSSRCRRKTKIDFVPIYPVFLTVVAVFRKPNAIPLFHHLSDSKFVVVMAACTPSIRINFHTHLNLKTFAVVSKVTDKHKEM